MFIFPTASSQTPSAWCDAIERAERGDNPHQVLRRRLLRCDDIGVETALTRFTSCKLRMFLVTPKICVSWRPMRPADS